jgi:hypothetical protein
MFSINGLVVFIGIHTGILMDMDFLYLWEPLAGLFMFLTGLNCTFNELFHSVCGYLKFYPVQ